MDSFGYKNWGDSNDSDPYQFQNDRKGFGSKSSKSKKNSHGGDGYDFDITGDGDESPEATWKSNSSRNKVLSGTQPSRRMSIEERTKEILERNKRDSVESLRSEPQQDSYISMIKSSWDDAIGVRASDASLYETLHKVVDSSNEISRNGGVSPLSDKDDSFNISASDFEVRECFVVF